VYVIDLLIPASLGGTSTRKNLWPLRRVGRAGLVQERAMEARLFAEVCAGRLPLDQAQNLVRQNWWAAYRGTG
jgi:hypothetical protein